MAYFELRETRSGRRDVMSHQPGPKLGGCFDLDDRRRSSRASSFQVWQNCAELSVELLFRVERDAYQTVMCHIISRR